MNSRDILQLIAEQIDDSVTWCRFSQVSKVCYRLCKQLLKHEVHELVLCYAHEFRTRLPSGVLHGEVRGEKRNNRHTGGHLDSNGILRQYDRNPYIFGYEWWYSKTYCSGKPHGYYTVGTVMAEYQNGKQLSSAFFNNSDRRISLQYMPAYFWKEKGPLSPDRLNFDEFEAFTQRTS